MDNFFILSLACAFFFIGRMSKTSEIRDENRIDLLDSRLTKIETIMVMQNFMPTKLARREKIVDCEYE